jgi:hypothetical protein
MKSFSITNLRIAGNLRDYFWAGNVLNCCLIFKGEIHMADNEMQTEIRKIVLDELLQVARKIERSGKGPVAAEGAKLVTQQVYARLNELNMAKGRGPVDTEF